MIKATIDFSCGKNEVQLEAGGKGGDVFSEAAALCITLFDQLEAVLPGARDAVMIAVNRWYDRKEGEDEKD